MVERRGLRVSNSKSWPTTRMVVAASLMAIVCACATSYQSKRMSGGFSETRLGENVFQVSFRGNAYTHEERVADFTLLRSADLTLENSFRYFVIVDE